MLEREVKLGAASSFRLPALSGIVEGVDAEAKPELQLSATYFDTDDLRLTRWGVSLRYRSNDGWTVKLPHTGDRKALVRDELMLSGDAGRLPAEAVDLVSSFVRAAPLRPQVRLSTVRRQTSLRDGEGQVVADVVDDDVAVRDGRRIVARFRELEVEITDETQGELLDTLVARLRAAGAGAPDPTPKVVRALGPRALQPPELVLEQLRPNATVEEVVRRALSASVERLIRHDPVVRMDNDPEGVHQARVATRRLRSDLRTFGPLLEDEWAPPLREELAWLAGSLGSVRDLDVLLMRMRKRVAGLPREDARSAGRLLATLEADREQAYGELLASLRSERYPALLDRLIEAANEPAFLPGSDRVAAEIVQPLVQVPLRKLSKQVSALDEEPDDEALHAIRIRAKRTRYAAEAAAPVLGKRARTVAAAAAKLQDVLGEHQDAVVAEGWLRAWTRGNRSVPAAFVAGELAALERRSARRAAGRWRKAWKALAAARAQV
jgi:CHAD domain-containing protein